MSVEELVDSGKDSFSSRCIICLRNDFFFFFGECGDECKGSTPVGVVTGCSSVLRRDGRGLTCTTFMGCSPSEIFSQFSTVRGDILGGGGAGGKLSMSSSAGPLTSLEMFATPKPF